MKKLLAKVVFPDTVTANPFSERKTYHFVTNIENLEAGDSIIVDTVNGLKIAEFVSYSGEDLEFGETFNHKKARWIIQKVDLTAHNKRIEDAARLEDLKKKMELRRKKAEEIKIYEILAQADPEMADLLKEFKQLKEEVI